MNPDDMLMYRHLLCGALGGLDGYEERRAVAWLIGKIDKRMGWT